MIELPEAARIPVYCGFGLLVLIVLTLLFRRPIVRAVLWTSEVLTLLSIIFMTLLSGVGGGVGGWYLATMKGDYRPAWEIPTVQGLFITGLISGFLFSVIWASFFLALTQIERNTKQVAI